MEYKVKADSSEWFKLQKSVLLTAPQFADAIGVGKDRPFHFFQTIIEENLDDVSFSFSSENQFTQHGEKLENILREAYELLTGLQVQETGFWFPLEKSSLFGLIGASPHGVVVNKDSSEVLGIVEFTAPIHKQRDEFLDTVNGISRQFMVEIQGQMAICGASWCDFMAVCLKKKEIMLKRIFFQPLYWEYIARCLKQFCFGLQEVEIMRELNREVYSGNMTKRLQEWPVRNKLFPAEHMIRVQNLLAQPSPGMFRGPSQKLLSYSVLVGEPYILPPVLDHYEQDLLAKIDAEIENRFCQKVIGTLTMANKEGTEIVSCKLFHGLDVCDPKKKKDLPGERSNIWVQSVNRIEEMQAEIVEEMHFESAEERAALVNHLGSFASVVMTKGNSQQNGATLANVINVPSTRHTSNESEIDSSSILSSTSTTESFITTDPVETSATLIAYSAREEWEISSKSKQNLAIKRTAAERPQLQIKKIMNKFTAAAETRSNLLSHDLSKHIVSATANVSCSSDKDLSVCVGNEKTSNVKDMQQTNQNLDSCSKIIDLQSSVPSLGVSYAISPREDIVQNNAVKLVNTEQCEIRTAQQGQALSPQNEEMSRCTDVSQNVVIWPHSPVNLKCSTESKKPVIDKLISKADDINLPLASRDKLKDSYVSSSKLNPVHRPWQTQEMVRGNEQSKVGKRIKSASHGSSRVQFERTQDKLALTPDNYGKGPLGLHGWRDHFDHEVEHKRLQHLSERGGARINFASEREKTESEISIYNSSQQDHWHNLGASQANQNLTGIPFNSSHHPSLSLDLSEWRGRQELSHREPLDVSRSSNFMRENSLRTNSNVSSGVWRKHLQQQRHQPPLWWQNFRPRSQLQAGVRNHLHNRPWRHSSTQLEAHHPLDRHFPSMERRDRRLGETDVELGGETAHERFPRSFPSGRKGADF